MGEMPSSMQVPLLLFFFVEREEEREREGKR